MYAWCGAKHLYPFPPCLWAYHLSPADSQGSMDLCRSPLPWAPMPHASCLILHVHICRLHLCEYPNKEVDFSHPVSWVWTAKNNRQTGTVGGWHIKAREHTLSLCVPPDMNLTLVAVCFDAIGDQGTNPILLLLLLGGDVRPHLGSVKVCMCMHASSSGESQTYVSFYD